MYFPYLRGKQFELLALRDFAAGNQSYEKVIPIIEPVKQQFGGLNTAISTMLGNGLRFAIILNPTDGDFKHPNVKNDILESLPSLVGMHSGWIPAYIYNRNTNVLINHIAQNDLRQVMIILPNGADVNDEELMEFLRNGNVAYIVNGNNRNRSTRARLLRLNKSLISLEDRFNNKARNADYADPDDEFFSDDFAYYNADGLYGFSDYTTLPKDFIEGGMMPYAIAIHLTYQKADDQIFVHHFVSDSNFDQSNVHGKFHEAAIKIAPFYDNGIAHTLAVDELIEKANQEGGYPGLGYIKKLSILNHLELINGILSD
jgi:hypothetical protein